MPTTALNNVTSGHRRPGFAVLLCTAPQSVSHIFTEHAYRALTDEFAVTEVTDPADPAIDQVLPAVSAVVGQIDFPAERVARAPHLRAILNVEGNFYPNVDYAACFDRGIYILGCGPAYAEAVAEYSLGLALDLCRGITREDRAFRAGTERYVSSGNADAVLLGDCRIGLIGMGNLGRALVPLLHPFRAPIRAHDPWLPDAVLAAGGLHPASLADVLRTSDVLFVLASVTEANEHLLDARALSLLPDHARLILVGRASIVDFQALLDQVRSGRITAAIDVWPREPVPRDDPFRLEEGVVLSAHRAGGIPSAFTQIGDMVLDDLRQIAGHLPPARMQVAARELVGRYRNRPVDQRAFPANA